MMLEQRYGLYGEGKSRYFHWLLSLILLTSLFISSTPPFVEGASLPYPIFGYVTSCDNTSSYQEANVTVFNPNTGVVKYDTTENDGSYLVTFGTLIGPDEWQHGDPLIIWVNGTGQYANYTGEHVSMFDKNIPAPHRINVTICCDTTPPETSHQFLGIEGCQGWYKGNVIVTLNASDNFSGVLSTQYRIGNDSFQNYSGPFTLNGEGIDTLTYFSIDTIGNKEKEHIITIKIDKTPPETTCSLKPPIPNGNNGWNIKTVQVTLSPSDRISGINDTWYRLNGGNWQKYTDLVNLQNDGEYSMEYYSTDNACHTEPIRSVGIKIDTVDPSVNLKKPKEDMLYIFDRELIRLPFRTLIIGKITIETQATDTTSGIDKVLFYVDDELRHTNTTEHPEWIYDERAILFHRHTLKAKAIDIAGNTKETNKLDIWYFNL